MVEEQNTQDPREFVHQWAKDAINRLAGLFDCAHWEPKFIAAPRLSFAEVLDSFFILRAQQELLDFTDFDVVPEEPVNIFGRHYASYHKGIAIFIPNVLFTIGTHVFHVDDVSQLTTRDPMGINPGKRQCVAIAIGSQGPVHVRAGQEARVDLADLFRRGCAGEVLSLDAGRHLLHSAAHYPVR